MPYAVVAVDGSVGWPSVATTIEFEGRTLTLRPGSTSLYPTVYTKYEPDAHQAFAHAISVMRRFLSALAWTHETPVRDVMTSGGGFPVNLGRAQDLPEPTSKTLAVGRWEPRGNYLPQPSEPGARLALALYREAMGLEHDSVPYAFLGYAKILNISLRDGKKQIAWINDAIPKLKDHFANKRVSEIAATEPDIGDYLYASGRCAIAHANGDPIVDPDDATDTIRLSRDLPVIKALAEYFVEHELGVKSITTIYSEHLYELDRFRTIFGAERIASIKMGEVSDLAVPDIPDLTVRIDTHGTTEEPEFVALRPAMLEFPTKGVAVLSCVSSDKRLRLALALDFKNERLPFDPERQIVIVDDGAVETIDYAITRVKFIEAMVSNGRLEVLNAATRERLGRTDPCIPVNIDPAGTMENLAASLVRLKEERERRSKAPNASGSEATSS